MRLVCKLEKKRQPNSCLLWELMADGLEHVNWNKNLKLAIRIQEKANQMYPGLFKPIVLRNSRYNQHVTTGASIIEVGATGNTIEQCNTSMKYLANVIDAVMKDCTAE